MDWTVFRRFRYGGVCRTRAGVRGRGHLERAAGHRAGATTRYAYDAAGRLATRTWAHGVVTTYSYDGWNNLTNTVYSDGTPTVSLMYDALGRQTNAVDAAGTTKLTYDAYGALKREKVSGLYSKTLQRHYDDFGRGTGYTIDGTRMTVVEYEEDSGRIHRIKSGGVWLSNRYLAGSDLRDRIKYGSSGYTYYTYEDSRDLLAQVRSDFGGDTISQYDYANDALGRRTEIARSGTAMSETRTDAYGYNDRNELIYSRRGAESAEITEYAYAYDDIGNRLSSLDLGTNHTYTANNLNQYTQISNLCVSARGIHSPIRPRRQPNARQDLDRYLAGHIQRREPPCQLVLRLDEHRHVL